MAIPDSVLQDKEFASQALADYLRNGQLALIIGAGISSQLGLPLWWQLVHGCAERAGLVDLIDEATEKTPSETLRQLMDKVEDRIGDQEKYKSLVKDVLYSDAEFTETIIRERLLIAIGALLMSSKRGKIDIVINFNFDDLLERYLSLHGFEAQVIARMPSILRDSDVTVYHPHGFLPSEGKLGALESDALVLSQYSYDDLLGAETNPWRRLIESTLLSKIGLFVGISGQDPTFGPLLVAVKKQIALERTTGFWLLGPNEPKSSDFEKRNVIPLRFDSYDEMPTFLLQVCQLAARR